ncbi:MULTISPECIES: bifunctional hydroxymethylpyrimidine kinase/phosphomethylpyrimidine kinase [Bacillaceae]|uniref:Hydroxymethylpyrimidine/phosphomethylpyrimidine kinase n=1 Tax=Evansella alkalicola TaxID=745819 RepID=A0ABS6JNC9_9BACI|nr:MULTISPECIES: bifunctional hydroxymethylpyrimidine kinase/phosphomethylpyrimidine kinase [Bacillaceae]MBU9719988.1 bifunctional hydroxymethylpyrimidine kinase/phosphomethylpyrimidine kinase [Bacillus alkalicola]
MISRALTIAGSDSGGGAGIQADLKTFQELGVFGMSAITAITAQNTLGVQGVYPVELEGLEQQITSVADDIGVDAVKTGMLFDEPRIKLVAEKIKHYQWNNVVVDPVMIAKGGASLLTENSTKALINELLPLATVATPNIPEAEAIVGREITSIDDRKQAAKDFLSMGVKSVVIKGGHDSDGHSEATTDLFFDGSTYHYFQYPRVDTKNTHGTGCSFASAITAELAKGTPLMEAVLKAKRFIHLAIIHSLNIGGGHGPTHHGAHRQYETKELDSKLEGKTWHESALTK